MRILTGQIILDFFSSLLFQIFEPAGPPVGNGWGDDPAAGETWDVYVKS